MARSLLHIVRDERGGSAAKVIGITCGVINLILGLILTMAAVAVTLEESEPFVGLFLVGLFAVQAVGGVMLIHFARKVDSGKPVHELKGAVDEADEVVVSRTQVAGPVPGRQAAPASAVASAPRPASVQVVPTPVPAPLPVQPVPVQPVPAQAPSGGSSENEPAGTQDTDDVAALIMRSDDVFATLKDLVRHDEAARAQDKSSDHRHLSSMLNAVDLLSWNDAPVCGAGRLSRNHHFWIRLNVDELDDDTYDELISCEAALSLNQDLPEARKLTYDDSATMLATAALLRNMVSQSVKPLDLSGSLGVAYPHATPAETPGEWSLRASLVSAIECLVTPFRVVYDLRSNVAEGVVVVSLELVRPRCMLIATTLENTVAWARAYALRLAALVARQAFDIDQRVMRVVVNGHERASQRTVLSLDLTRGMLKRLMPALSSEGIERDGFPVDDAIRARFDARGWFDEVEPFLTLESTLVSPLGRFVYPELNNRACSERLQAITGARTVSELGINENAQRIAAWEQLIGDPWDTTESAVARLMALRDSTHDITVMEACGRTANALVTGAIDVKDIETLQRLFIAGSALEAAVARAETALEDGHEDPEAALSALKEVLDPIQALGPYIDDETTVYRYFGSLPERMCYNLLLHDHIREVRLVPDAYYNALSNASIAHAMLGNDAEAMACAEEMMRIAPASIHAALRKVRLLENSSRVFEAADLIRRMLCYASTPRDAAICHYRLAFMEWKLGREDLGVACYQRSLHWETEMSAQAREELGDLLEANEDLKRLSDDEVEALLKKEGIPLGCDEGDVRRMAGAAALTCDEGIFWAARPLTGILYGVDGDDVMMGIYRSLAPVL